MLELSVEILVGLFLMKEENAWECYFKAHSSLAVPVINHFIEDYDKNGAYTGSLLYVYYFSN